MSPASTLSDKALQVAKLHLLESGKKVDYRKVSRGRIGCRTARPLRCGHLPGDARARSRPASVIAACAKLVKPGGWIFFSTLNRNPKSYLLAVIGAEYILNMLPRGTHDYAKFIKPSELAQSCRNAGLNLVDLTGMSYNPLSRTYSLGKDTDVNYMIACRRE